MSVCMKYCPRCKGAVVVVGRRAWCVQPFAVGGCGAWFTYDGGAWREK